MPTKLTHRYEPHGAAREVLSCREDEVLLSGPAGTGKSRACLEKLHLLMLLNPGARGLIVRKTATSLTNTALITFDKHVAPEALEAGLVQWYGGSAREAAQYRYTNGSTINVGGMDKATRVMSAEYDAIYVQEATELSEGDWEALTTRLRNGRISFQQLIADCNPDTPTHWLKQRCDKGTTLMLNSRHEDNPIYFDASGNLTERGTSYISKLDALTGVRLHRLRFGRWVAAEGVIYEEWDHTTHLIDSFDVPWEWPRYWAVDFGYTNPMVIQRWAEDPDGRLYLYAEQYRTQLTVDEHAALTLSEVTDADGKWIEPKPQKILCDHDAEGRVVFSRTIGMPTQAANKKVLDGIQAVQRRLRVAGDGKPRLFIMRDAVRDRDSHLVEAKKPTCTADEVPGYVWKDGGKEEPVKEDDHGADALRYLVADRDLRGSYGVRWLG
jgi:PBSX family phage terminase large subunit